MNKIKFVVLVLLVTAVGVVGIGASRAGTSGVTATVDVDSGCIGSVNGSNNSSANVTTGSSVTLTIQNGSGAVGQGVSGPGVPGATQVQPNNKNTSGTTVVSIGVVSSPITITFTPIPSSYDDPVFPNDCPMGSSPTASHLVINPVAPPASSSTSASKPKTTAVTSTPAATTTATAPATTTSPADVTSTKPSATETNTAPAEKSNTTWIVAGAVLLAALIGVGLFLRSKHIHNWKQFQQYWHKRR